jgi:two-component system, response regulator, stage 0 sporulation protein F
MWNVLVVDTYSEICDLVRLECEMRGDCHVTGATNGTEAVSLLERQHPDFALIEASIPGLSGFEIARRAVELEIPALLMTGHPDIALDLEKRQFPHILKPFRISGLFAEFEYHLANCEENRRRFQQALSEFAARKEAIRAVLKESHELVEKSRKMREARAKGRDEN